tara:strand:- start:43416 stop:43757 length:342 start_codon:yes stop_codon:yes gene_type:complete
MINPRPIMVLMLLCISLLILLQGCAAPGFIAGTSATTATASGSYQTFKTVSLMKAGVDTALAAEGKKTTTDHVVSTITGMDCKAMRIIEEEALQVYCLQTKPDFLSPLREEKE